MKTDIKKKWVKALRSGKYEQGTGELKQRSFGELKYCCLGVLCEVAGLMLRDKGDVWFAGQTGEATLTDHQLKRVGLKDHEQQRLAAMNDASEYIDPDGVPFVYQKKQSFKQIANWIERNL